MGDAELLEHAGLRRGRLCELLLEEVLTRPWRLPELRELVPLEASIAQTGRVGHPGAN